jgi:hypothetical protein
LAVVGGALKTILTVSLEAVQGAFEIVHCNTYAPAPPAGVNVAVGDEVELNCDSDIEGPETIDHAPVPLVGVLAASVADTEVVQSV